MNIIICDGSCINNPGPGGWAYAFIDESRKVSYHSGSVNIATNNTMELAALIESLKHGQASTIYTDSTYIVNGVNVWLKGWKKANWKNSQNKVIKNLELWQLVDQLYDGTVEVKWIKGHAKAADYQDKFDPFLIEIQNKVDQLARRTCTEYRCDK